MAPTPVPATPGENAAENRVINFAAGPSQLPVEILRTAQSEMLNYNNTGCCVMELSHRGQVFDSIIREAEQLFRDLLHVPSNYKVLFMQGGGCGQFASVAMNLFGRNKSGVADYIVTGRWSTSAAKEAQKFGKVHFVIPENADRGSSACRQIPPRSQWQFSEDPAYVYFCDNETVDGIEFLDLPEVPANVPLVADMSSNILSRTIDISKFGLIFAGAQKNMGPSGLCVVIIREDLLNYARPDCPSVMSYKVMAENRSLYNTPPTYSIYITLLVLKWVRDAGGVEKMMHNSEMKSKLIFDLIENSNGFYASSVAANSRSRVNIVFRLKGGEALEKKFVEEAKRRGMVHLEGHRSVGGLRASLYNAITVPNTRKLLDFMKEFANVNGARI